MSETETETECTLVIDTTEYTGNFEGSLFSYLTGQPTYQGAHEMIAELSRLEEPELTEAFSNLVAPRFGEYGAAYSSMYEYDTDSVEIYLDCSVKHISPLLPAILARAIRFGKEEYNFKVRGVRVLEKTTTTTTTTTKFTQVTQCLDKAP